MNCRVTSHHVLWGWTPSERVLVFEVRCFSPPDDWCAALSGAITMSWATQPLV